LPEFAAIRLLLENTEPATGRSARPFKRFLRFIQSEFSK